MFAGVITVYIEAFDETNAQFQLNQIVDDLELKNLSPFEIASEIDSEVDPVSGEYLDEKE